MIVDFGVKIEEFIEFAERNNWREAIVYPDGYIRILYVPHTLKFAGLDIDQIVKAQKMIIINQTKILKSYASILNISPVQRDTLERLIDAKVVQWKLTAN